MSLEAGATLEISANTGTTAICSYNDVISGEGNVVVNHADMGKQLLLGGKIHSPAVRPSNVAGLSQKELSSRRCAQQQVESRVLMAGLRLMKEAPVTS